jgi:hypothetical protein
MKACEEIPSPGSGKPPRRNGRAKGTPRAVPTDPHDASFGIRFVADSPLEEDGFELSVPG